MYVAIMKQIALFATATLVSLSVAGCAVEVPMSAFQLGPLSAEQDAAAKPQQNPNAEPPR
ncbi:hypothetical protein AUC70_12925 [Methyloceanibacter stevinii]|uniref:Lipoprotein n=1 Tax=Methyloceanibacter stevinii TaxID=1774970 RepID=A0A1E3VUG8_9HYPH|nr:hypothetical protein AUC70_12925 [Methyloceanibacter stevinii]